MSGKSNKTIRLLRRAFTLIEMLIAMALTLILVYSIAEFYAYIGNHVRDSRAVIEMTGQLRGAAQQLNDDLNSLSLRPEPWIDSASSPGYFTVYEGPYSDSYPDGYVNISTDTDTDNIPDLVEGTSLAADGTTLVAPTGATNLLGDGDDILAMTIRAGNTPFQAQAWNSVLMQNQAITSQYAEVIWFTAFYDRDGDSTWDISEPRFLCRRLLLIIPGYPIGLASGETVSQFVQNAEISFRFNTSGQPVANSLADLSLRHCRFGCQAITAPYNPTYPSPMRLNPTQSGSLTTYTMQNTKLGEDRVLSNLLAFDVRVYDPAAPVYRDSATNNAAVKPGDYGYAAAVSNPNLQGYGAWVDLSYNRGLAVAANSHFSGTPSASFNLGVPAAPATDPYNFHHWDTWSLAYELSNVGNGPGTGRSVNGLDDNVSGATTNGVDDASERETQPPYASLLRGVQVRIRIYEPQTRQPKQVTVGADFVAE